MLLVLFAIAAVLSYWVSWELESKLTRPSFAAKFFGDCAALLKRDRAAVETAETRTASA
jgi:hypothetical protein